MLVERGERYRFASRRVELVAQVDVVYVATAQFGVALHVARKVEVVVNRRRNLAELRSVDASAVREAHLVAIVELIRSVQRREEIVRAVVAAVLALLRVARVRNQFHVVMLETHAGMHAQLAQRQVYGSISCPHEVVRTVIVAHLHLLEHIQTVVAHIRLVAEQTCHVALLEVGGQSAYRRVPLVVESSRVVSTCAILAVAAHLQRRLP